MKIELAKENDIISMLEILKQRCEWLRQNKINQWGDWYYTELYNMDYFIKIRNIHKLYVVKEKDEVMNEIK